MSLKVLEEINKKFGEKAILSLGDESFSPKDKIATGILSLDKILGGGFPKGKMVEIYSESGCGKTGICLLAMANAQKQGYKVAIVDMEHALDPNFASLLGLDINEVFISQPNEGSEALTILQMLVKSGEFGVVLLDSIAALTPLEEVDAEYGDSIIGRLSKLMGQACRRLTPIANQTGTCVLWNNQLRSNVGAIGHAETTITTGGKALPFFASIRLQLQRIQQVKSGDVVTGHMIRATTKKNKLTAPFKSCEYEITYGKHHVIINDLIENGVKLGLIEKTGAWFKVANQKFQGKENLKEFLISDPVITNVLEKEIKEKLGLTI